MPGYTMDDIRNQIQAMQDQLTALATNLSEAEADPEPENDELVYEIAAKFAIKGLNAGAARHYLVTALSPLATPANFERVQTSAFDADADWMVPGQFQGAVAIQSAPSALRISSQV